MYPVQVTATLTLTSDLVYRVIMSGAYFLNHFRLESQIGSIDASQDDGVWQTILGSL